MNIELTKEQREWFGERLKESPTGRVIVGSDLVKKYREITSDYTAAPAIIRDIIIRRCN